MDKKSKIIVGVSAAIVVGVVFLAIKKKTTPTTIDIENDKDYQDLLVLIDSAKK